MIKIAILANCQGAILKMLLQKHLGNNVRFLNIPRIDTVRENSDVLDSIYSNLNEIDYILTQPLSDSFGVLSTNNIKKNINKSIIVFPNIHFSGFHPEMFYLKHQNLNANRDFMVDYHDSIILYGYLNGINKKIISNTFYEKSFYTTEVLDKINTISLENLMEKEKICDIQISDMISSKAVKETLFYSMNHPSSYLLNIMAKRVLKKLNYFGSYTHENNLLDDVIFPSYVSVEEYFSTNCNNQYLIHNKIFTREDMVEAYYTFYEKIPKETLLLNIEILKKSKISNILLTFMEKKLNNIIGDVLVGKDNWLFLYNGAQKQFAYLSKEIIVTNKSVENFTENIISRKAYLDSKSIIYRHLVFPSKPLVKTVYLPDDKNNIVSLFNHYYHQALPADFINKFVLYPLEVLCDIDSTNSTFKKLDTHMSDKGYLLVANNLLKSVGIDIDESLVEYVNNENMSGDLARMLSLDQEYNEEIVLYDNTNIETVLNSDFLDGNSNEVYISYNNASKTKKRLLIFGDSFFKDTLKHLYPYFKDIIYIRSQFLHKDVIELYSPDIVFSGNAERYLSNVTSDALAENFLLALYGKNSFVPSIEYIDAFKAQMSFKYHNNQYQKWENKFKNSPDKKLNMKTYSLNNQLVCTQTNKLIFDSLGRDPYIIFKGLTFQANKKYLFKVKLISSVDSVFQIFYSDKELKEPIFKEKRSLKKKIVKGVNELEFILTYQNLGAWLRIDPMECKGLIEILEYNIFKV